jgi:hypothetical protein
MRVDGSSFFAKPIASIVLELWMPFVQSLRYFTRRISARAGVRRVAGGPVPRGFKRR